MTASSQPAANAASPRLDRLEQLLRVDPENPLLLADTADAAIAAGAFDRAQELVDAGLAATGSLPGWRFRQATLYIARRRLDDARAVLLALERDGGKHPTLSHNIAYVEFLKGDLEACLKVLEPWMGGAAGGEDSSLQVLWLRAMHRLDRMEEAWEWVQTRMAARALSPQGAGIASLIALDLTQMDAAAALSKEALATGAPQLEALVASASVALSAQDAPRARQLLEAGLRLNPDDARVWSTLGFVSMLEERLPDARKAIEKALEIAPGHVETWQGLGWACVLQQDWPAATSALEEALRLDPDYGESHGALAVVLALQGRTDAARKHCERALELDPSSVSARYASAIISGEARDLKEMQRLAGRLMSRSRRRAR